MLFFLQSQESAFISSYVMKVKRLDGGFFFAVLEGEECIFGVSGI